MISDFNTTDLVPIFNYLKDVPFDVRRKQFYSPFELYAGFSPDDAHTFERDRKSVV